MTTEGESQEVEASSEISAGLGRDALLERLRWIASDFNWKRITTAQAKSTVPTLVDAIKTIEKEKALAEIAEKLASALDGYIADCGEGHSRPNFECLTCGNEERILSEYRALVKA